MTEPRGVLKAHQQIFRGRIFAVDADRVRLPNGHETTLEIVRHPGSVVLLPMPDPSHLILVKQYRYAIDRWIWELAAGSLEAGETPEAGAARECEEEIGLVPGRVDELGTFYPTPGYCDEKMIFFRLTELAEPAPGAGSAQKDPDEDLRVRTFTLDEVHSLVRDGTVIDAKTVVGLTLIGGSTERRTTNGEFGT
jgi:ADP-ribose pyrophosphatase